MGLDYKGTIQRLQLGINKYADALEEQGIPASHVMFNTNQFFSPQQRRPINMYIIKIVEWSEEKQKNEYTEVFKTAQQLYVVFFLRNYLYRLRGEEIPVTDFPDFEKMWKMYLEEFE